MQSRARTTGAAIDVDSTPLAATNDPNTTTATASVTFTHGIARVFVQATWKPQ